MRTKNNYIYIYNTCILKFPHRNCLFFILFAEIRNNISIDFMKLTGVSSNVSNNKSKHNKTSLDF
jgi:hypothetical protein